MIQKQGRLEIKTEYHNLLAIVEKSEVAGCDIPNQSKISKCQILILISTLSQAHYFGYFAVMNAARSAAKYAPGLFGGASE
jgi:hypothetical protein